MNEQLRLLELIEKHHKSAPIPIQHQHIFPYFKNKIQFSVLRKSDQKVNYKPKNRPQNFYLPAKTECHKNGTSYICQYIWELPPSPYNQAMMSRKKLGKHLVFNRFIAAHFVFKIQFCQ